MERGVVVGVEGRPDESHCCRRAEPVAHRRRLVDAQVEEEGPDVDGAENGIGEVRRWGGNDVGRVAVVEGQADRYVTGAEVVPEVASGVGLGRGCRGRGRRSASERWRNPRCSTRNRTMRCINALSS